MSYLNDYDEFPEIKYCPFCGGKVETGRLDLVGEGVLKAKWYADNKSANPDVVCFLATGRRKTVAAFCERCFMVVAVLETMRPDGAIL